MQDDEKAQMISTCVAVLEAYIVGAKPNNGIGAYGSMQRLADTLTVAGWKVLGSGSYGCVLKSPHLEGVVFKFGVCAYDAAVEFALWARANQHLPHLPEILDLRRFPQGFVYVMPEYFPCPEVEEVQEKRRVFERILQGNNCWGDPVTDEERAAYPTAVAMQQYFENCCGVDLHAWNVMLDAEGNMIITDPYATDRTAPNGEEN